MHAVDSCSRQLGWGYKAFLFLLCLLINNVLLGVNNAIGHMAIEDMGTVHMTPIKPT